MSTRRSAAVQLAVTAFDGDCRSRVRDLPMIETQQVASNDLMPDLCPLKPRDVIDFCSSFFMRSVFTPSRMAFTSFSRITASAFRFPLVFLSGCAH